MRRTAPHYRALRARDRAELKEPRPNAARIARRNPAEDRLSLPEGIVDEPWGMLPRSWHFLVAAIPLGVAFNVALTERWPAARCRRLLRSFLRRHLPASVGEADRGEAGRHRSAQHAAGADGVRAASAVRPRARSRGPSRASSESNEAIAMLVCLGAVAGRASAAPGRSHYRRPDCPVAAGSPPAFLAARARVGRARRARRS